jgi:hypothetical protein
MYIYSYVFIFLVGHFMDWEFVRSGLRVYLLPHRTRLNGVIIGIVS